MDSFIENHDSCKKLANLAAQLGLDASDRSLNTSEWTTALQTPGCRQFEAGAVPGSTKDDLTYESFEETSKKAFDSNLLSTNNARAVSLCEMGTELTCGSTSPTFRPKSRLQARRSKTTARNLFSKSTGKDCSAKGNSQKNEKIMCSEITESLPPGLEVASHTDLEKCSVPVGNYERNHPNIAAPINIPTSVLDDIKKSNCVQLDDSKIISPKGPHTPLAFLKSRFETSTPLVPKAVSKLQAHVCDVSSPICSENNSSSEFFSVIECNSPSKLDFHCDVKETSKNIAVERSAEVQAQEKLKTVDMLCSPVKLPQVDDCSDMTDNGSILHVKKRTHSNSCSADLEFVEENENISSTKESNCMTSRNNLELLSKCAENQHERENNIIQKNEHLQECKTCSVNHTKSFIDVSVCHLPLETRVLRLSEGGRKKLDMLIKGERQNKNFMYPKASEELKKFTDNMLYSSSLGKSENRSLINVDVTARLPLPSDKNANLPQPAELCCSQGFSSLSTVLKDRDGLSSDKLDDKKKCEISHQKIPENLPPVANSEDSLIFPTSEDLENYFENLSTQKVVQECGKTSPVFSPRASQASVLIRTKRKGECESTDEHPAKVMRKSSVGEAIISSAAYPNSALVALGSVVPVAGFCTAAGKHVKVGLEALKKAERLWQDCSEGHDKSAIDSTFSSAGVNHDIMITKSSVYAAEESSAFTAELKEPIAVSDENIKQINAIWNESPTVTSQGASFSSSSCSGFVTGLGRKVIVQEQSLNYARALWNSMADVRKDLITSDGRLIHNKDDEQCVPTDHVKKSDFIIPTLNSSNLNTCVSCETSGVDSLTDAALQRAEMLFSEYDLSIKTENDTLRQSLSPKQPLNVAQDERRNVGFEGFRTARGSKVEVNKEALEKANEMWSEIQREVMFDSVTSASHLLQTPVEMSDSSDPKKTFKFDGFLTASGLVVTTSEASLNKARMLWNEEEDSAEEHNVSSSSDYFTKLLPMGKVQRPPAGKFQKSGFIRHNVSAEKITGESKGLPEPASYYTGRSKTALNKKFYPPNISQVPTASKDRRFVSCRSFGNLSSDTRLSEEERVQLQEEITEITEEFLKDDEWDIGTDSEADKRSEQLELGCKQLDDFKDSLLNKNCDDGDYCETADSSIAVSSRADESTIARAVLLHKSPNNSDICNVDLLSSHVATRAKDKENFSKSDEDATDQSENVAITPSAVRNLAAPQTTGNHLINVPSDDAVSCCGEEDVPQVSGSDDLSLFPSVEMTPVASSAATTLVRRSSEIKSKINVLRQQYGLPAPLAPLPSSSSAVLRMPFKTPLSNVHEQSA